MMILKPYADADYYSVSQYFLKKEIDCYVNRGGYLILSLLGIYKSFFRLLVDDKQLLGTGVIRWKYSRDTKRFGYWLYAIWIHPDFRGKGYGVVLMEYLFDELRMRNVKKVHLTVNNANTIAQNLYKKLGFVEIKQNKQYIVMQYDL